MYYTRANMFYFQSLGASGNSWFYVWQLNQVDWHIAIEDVNFTVFYIILADKFSLCIIKVEHNFSLEMSLCV